MKKKKQKVKCKIEKLKSKELKTKLLEQFSILKDEITIRIDKKASEIFINEIKIETENNIYLNQNKNECQYRQKKLNVEKINSIKLENHSSRSIQRYHSL